MSQGSSGNPPPGGPSSTGVPVTQGVTPGLTADDLSGLQIEAESTKSVLKQQFDIISEALRASSKDANSFGKTLKEIAKESFRLSENSKELNSTIADLSKQFYDASATSKAFFKNLEDSIERNSQTSRQARVLMEENILKLNQKREELFTLMNQGFENAEAAAEARTARSLKLQIKQADENAQHLKERQAEIKKDYNFSAEAEEAIKDIIKVQQFNFDAGKKISNSYIERAAKRKNISEEEIKDIKAYFDTHRDLQYQLNEQQEAADKKQQKLDEIQSKKTEEQLEREKAALQQTEQGEEEVAAQIRAIELHNQELAAIIALSEAKNLQSKHTDTLGNSMESFLDKLTGVTAKSNLFGSALISMTAKSSDFGNAMKDGFLKAFLDPEASILRFTNFINEKLIKSSFEYDKTISNMNKSTGGFGKEFEKVAFNTQLGLVQESSIAGLSKYGIGIEELSKSYGTLANKLTYFNNLSDEQRKIFAVNAAELEKLGVSTSDYGDLLNKFMGGIGKTAEGAKNDIKALTAQAIAAGRNVGEYVATFNKMSESLAGFGREAIQIFKELAGMSQTMKGVTEQDLAKVSANFDTFEGAAKAASNLSLALRGVGVNIIDLMSADPSERIMKIKRAYIESGQEFDKMNIGYKRAVAEALGFGNNLEKAGAFLRADMAEMQSNMYKAVASEKEIEERKKRSADAQERLSKAIDSMKIALTPIINLFGLIGDVISSMNETIGGLGTFLITGFALAVPAVMGMMKLVSSGAKFLFTEIGASGAASLKPIEAELDVILGKIQAAKGGISTLGVPAAGGSLITPPIPQSPGLVGPNGLPLAPSQPSPPAGPPAATGWSTGTKVMLGLGVLATVMAGYSALKNRPEYNEISHAPGASEEEKKRPPPSNVVTIPAHDEHTDQFGNTVLGNKGDLIKTANEKKSPISIEPRGPSTKVIIGQRYDQHLMSPNINQMLEQNNQINKKDSSLFKNKNNFIAPQQNPLQSLVKYPINKENNISQSLVKYPINKENNMSQSLVNKPINNTNFAISRPNNSINYKNNLENYLLDNQKIFKNAENDFYNFQTNINKAIPTFETRNNANYSNLQKTVAMNPNYNKADVNNSYYRNENNFLKSEKAKEQFSAEDLAKQIGKQFALKLEENSKKYQPKVIVEGKISADARELANMFALQANVKVS